MSDYSMFGDGPWSFENECQRTAALMHRMVSPSGSKSNPIDIESQCDCLPPTACQYCGGFDEVDCVMLKNAARRRVQVVIDEDPPVVDLRSPSPALQIPLSCGPFAVDPHSTKSFDSAQAERLLRAAKTWEEYASVIASLGDDDEVRIGRVRDGSDSSGSEHSHSEFGNDCLCGHVHSECECDDCDSTQSDSSSGHE